jgi:acetyl-CoA carboxylase biotin carboxyl carrier protein
MSDIVEQIVNLVARSAVSAVTVRTPELRVTVRKPATASADPDHPVPRPAFPTVARLEPAPRAEASAESDLWTIRAQRVGVFRHAEPKITAGTSVRRGQTVGSIVSMNLPSEVRAHRDGVVSGVLVEDGSPVEFDQPLFSLSGAEGLPGDRSTP